MPFVATKHAIKTFLDYFVTQGNRMGGPFLMMLKVSDMPCSLKFFLLFIAYSNSETKVSNTDLQETLVAAQETMCKIT